MKARKPDGSRWFTPTTDELLDRWFRSRKLRHWLQYAVDDEQSGLLLVLSFEQFCIWSAATRIAGLGRKLAQLPKGES